MNVRSRVAVAGMCEAFDAVMFDCDGTLVESEPTSRRVLERLLGQAGWTLRHGEFESFFLGRSVRTRLDLIRTRIDVEDIDAWYQTYCIQRDEALMDGVAVTSGAHGLVERIARDTSTPLAVVSASSRTKVVLQLQRVGLLHFFEDRIFSGHEVSRNKPHPDLYLAAASTLQVDIARCLVIEDSIAGVSAGVAAGATVVAYRPSDAATSLTSLKHAGAAVVFDTMHQIDEWLFSAA